MDQAKESWLGCLDEEDIQFVRRFLLQSGSLKGLAEEYGVSYPTVRGRLDRLIAKVRVAEDAADLDPFERKIRTLVAEGMLMPTLAKELLLAHEAAIKRRSSK